MFTLTKMKLSLIFLVFAVFVETHGTLSWEKLAKKDFTDDHNRAILKALGRDTEQDENWKHPKATKGIAIEKTVFTLHTRNGPEVGVRINLNDDASLVKGGFDASKPIFFLTHGFLSSPDTSWVIDMKNAQLAALDSNFLTIDWSACASNIYYPTAVDCVPQVGKYLAQIITYLGTKGADYKKIHLIGHSLGAHIMAQVILHGIKVYRITGLDPAGPLFSEDDIDDRIDPSDADLVDIIHTSKGLLSYEKPTGDWDFYPNGGHNQPGCILDTCEHSMSHDFYIATISDNHLYPAVGCDSLDLAVKGDCKGETNYMGVASVDGPVGIFYSKISAPPLTSKGS